MVDINLKQKQNADDIQSVQQKGDGKVESLSKDIQQVQQKEMKEHNA